ncbi:sterile alpha motif domain-containing protein 3-like [Paramisgurnus dabryanus]|uniref:sterile alpha motif domain-containing protein 3-like n=2 Tax=Paramisgurnus dabryanus TaxID=90735 RepID=UPI0031F39C13
MSATLRVILGVDDAPKLILPNGIPDSIEDLKGEIQRQFGLSGNFRLQYRDVDFDNEFVNLTATSEIKDKSTVKVINLSDETVTLTFTTIPQGEDDVLLSSSSDTDILSSAESTSSGASLRSQPWPTNFEIPQFSYEVQIQLEKANQAFCSSGTLLKTSNKLRSDILDGLASEIIKYKVYPSSTELDDVAQALITKYPFLKEKGSVTGFYGWKISLKYKMANYRTRLRSIGCPELSINAVKEKRGALIHGPNQVKKPRKAEVNYCPDYPAGETKESLEEERKALTLEVKKKNNQQLIKSKMERTFAYRRQEVVKDMPFIAEFKNRWPALFSESQVNAEFTLITTVPLFSTFMSRLDHYSSHLIRVFKKKGGTARHDIDIIIAEMDKNPSVEVRRTCILKALCVYLNEKPDSLIKEYCAIEDMTEMERVALGVYIVRPDGADATDPPEDVGVVIEGCTVLQDLREIANGCAVLFGLMYCLNLSYPKELRYTFEFFQKVLMELDGNKLSTKVQVLKNKLHE